MRPACWTAIPAAPTESERLLASRGRRSPLTQPDQSGSRPTGWVASALGRSALRFVLASTLLGVVLVVARPLVYTVVARVARDVALWSAPAGLVSGLRWHEALERFVLDSLALGVSVHIGSLSIAFLLVIPAAFTWALPRPGRLRAAALQLGVCLGLGSAVVAHDLLAIVSRTLVAEGVAPFGAWRSGFYEGWIRMGWDLAMIALPAAACLWAVFPLLVEQDEPHPTPPPRRARAGRVVAAIASALLLLDLGATTRLADERSQQRFLRELGERDPDLPGYLLGRGLYAQRAGRLRDAEAFLERAALFPGTERRARSALAALREQEP